MTFVVLRFGVRETIFQTSSYVSLSSCVTTITITNLSRVFMSRLTLKHVQGRHGLRNFFAHAFAFLRSCYAVFRFVCHVQVMCDCDRIADTNRANRVYFFGMRCMGKKDVIQVTGNVLKWHETFHDKISKGDRLRLMASIGWSMGK